MKTVTLPPWYVNVAPTLPANRVLLTYPTPFSGIQVSMAWQAVNAMHYSQAGGGGPQGVPARAGSARAGFSALGHLAFGVLVPQPKPSATQLAAVRHALTVWGVNTVVIAPQPNAPLLLQGHDPTYAAAFMTAALGRMPVIQSGAWVWDNVSTAVGSARHLSNVDFAFCVLTSERAIPSTTANLRVSRCVLSVSKTAAG